MLPADSDADGDVDVADEVVEAGTPIATLEATEDHFIHMPVFLPRAMCYAVDTVIGGEVVARSTCTIRCQPQLSVYNLQGEIDGSDTIRLTWENAAPYVGIAIEIEGEKAASLPGDATNF